MGAALIAAAPFTRGRSKSRERALGNVFVACGIVLLVGWSFARSISASLPHLTASGSEALPFQLTAALSTQALCNLLALVGFGERFRRHGEDMDRWLALGSTLFLYASLNYVFTPLLANSFVSQGDFLRMLAYVPQLQHRGVLHWHIVLAFSTPRQRKAAEHYVAQLHHLAPRHEFGNIDRKLKPMKAAIMTANTSVLISRNRHISSGMAISPNIRR